VRVNIVVLVMLALLSVNAAAGTCDLAWDVNALMQLGRGQSFDIPLRLNDNKNSTTVNTVTVAQVQAFYEANESISVAAELSPKFVICSDERPNAFAIPTDNGPVVGVTVGMVKAVDGDRDMAAAVIGHEYTHHLKHHMEISKTRDSAFQFLGLIVGLALEYKTQQKFHLTNIGTNIGNMGAVLLVSKFNRDQEREADEGGFNFAVKTGFSPYGAIRLNEKMLKMGVGGPGMFLDNHPGGVERIELFRSMIARSPQAQELIAKVGEHTYFAGSSQQSDEPKTQLALLPSYQSTDAQKSFNEAVLAFSQKNTSEGMRHLKAASEAGDALAQVSLGYLYSKGEAGLAKDDKEAARLFKLSADQGNDLGQTDLGFAYMTGMGVKKDYGEALRLFKLSVEQGNAQAQSNLGTMYLHGLGIDKNYSEAIRLFQLSSDQGIATGQANLGYCYLHGLGVEKNKNEAATWFRKAAEQGLPDAVEALKKMGLAVSKEHNLPKTEQFQKFEKGDVELSCSSFSCGYNNGSSRKKYLANIADENWIELARLVMDVDFENDVNYYHLGLAAEKLGLFEAAQSYYKKSLNAKHQCVKLLGTCSGIDLPQSAKDGLSRVTLSSDTTTPEIKGLPREMSNNGL